MALLVKDRIKETTSTTGTGTLTLAGAVAGYQAFSVLGDGATTYYALTDANGTAWEVGLGTYASSGTTLARTTVLDSSNSGSKITLTSGTHDVFVTYPAGKAGFNDQGISKTFTADGAITAGKPCILTDAGKAAQVASSTSGVDVTEGWGTLAKITDNEGSKGFVSDDIGSGKVFVSYQDDNNSDYPTLVVATISGSGKSVTYGTPVVATSEACEETAVVWDSNASRFGVFWKRTSDGYIRGSTGTVSGTVPTIGSGTDLDATQVNYKLTGIFDPDQNDVIILYYGLDSGDYNAHASVIDISGSTPSVSYSVESPTLNGDIGGDGVIDIAYDTSADKFLIMSEESGGGGGGGNAIVMTNSGTALTLGSITEIRSGSFDFPSICFDDSVNKFLIGFSRPDDSDREYAIVGTISGTSVSFGTEVKLSDTGHNTHSAIGFDTTADKSIMFVGGHSGTATYYTISITGTVPSVVATGTVTGHGAGTYSGQQPRMSRTPITSESENPFLLVFKDTGSDSDIACQVFEFAQSAVTTKNLDNNYLGVASTSASDTNPVDINIVGSINNNQTGLTIGDDYFSDDAGNIKKFLTSTTTTNTQPTATVESLTTVNPSASSKIDIIYDTHNDKVWAYSKDGDNSNYPTVVVGDISSGTSITWGTPVTVTSNTYAPTGKMSQRNLASDGAGNILVAYRDTSNDYARVKIGNYSGTNSATFGNELQPENISSLNSMDIGYCSSSNLWYMFHGNSTSTKWVLMKQNSGAQTFDSWDYGTLYTGDATVINNVYNSTNNKIIVPLNQSSNGRFYVCNTSADGTTNTGYTLNIGTEQSITLSGSVNSDGRSKLILDTTNNNYILIDSENTTGMDCSVITESSGSLSQSTPQNVSTGTMSSNTAFYNPSDQKFYGAYQVYSSPYACKNYLLTVSGTTFTYVDGVDMPNATDRGVWTQGIYIADITKGVFVGQTNNGYDLLTAIMSIGTTTTYTKTNSQYIGKALSATALELKDQDPNTLYGQSEGAIAKGKPVIVEADGDFSEVKLSDTAVSYSAGSETEIDTDQIYQNTISYNSENDYFVVFYSETNALYYGYARSFQVTDKVISNNQSLGAFHTNTTKVLDSAYIGGSKHIVFYIDENDYLNARVVEIASDGTGTYGTENTINSGTTYRRGSCYYDSDKDVVVVIAGMDSSTCKAIACTVSGTTITPGAKQAVPSSDEQVYDTSSSYDVENSIGLVAWDRDQSSAKLNCATISLSGTGNRTITFGSVLEVYSGTNIIRFGSLTYDPVSKKHLLAYTYSPYSNVYGVVLTVSGTSVTKGTEASIFSGFDSNIAVQGSDQGGISIYYRDPSSPYYLKGVVATISGTDFTLSNESTLNAEEVKNGVFGDTAYRSSDNMTIVSYVTEANDYLEAIVTIPNGSISTPNLTAENYIGIAKDAASDNTTVIVQTVGSTDNNQNSLTPGQVYYVQTDGTLSTTAASPSVVAGRAISATKILITRS
jgi:hypothetical protein